MALATITAKGQVTIPKTIRDCLKIHAGDKIEIILTKDREAIIRPISKKVDDIFCKLHKSGKTSVSIDAMEEAVKKTVERKIYMKAIDTNILIRFLTGDDAIQAKKVYAIFKQAETERKELFVPLPVVLEMIWVLESAYEIARADIIRTLNDLLSMPVLKFDQPAVVQQLVLCAQKNTVDLSDILIAQSAKMSGCRTIITFDKKASKHYPFELVD